MTPAGDKARRVSDGFATGSDSEIAGSRSTFAEPVSVDLAIDRLKQRRRALDLVDNQRPIKASEEAFWVPQRGCLRGSAIEGDVGALEVGLCQLGYQGALARLPRADEHQDRSVFCRARAAVEQMPWESLSPQMDTALLLHKPVEPAALSANPLLDHLAVLGDFHGRP